MTAAVREDGRALVYAAPEFQDDEWLQLPARRASSRLPARARAFLKLARDQADAAVQSQVDLFLIKRDLADWISSKRKRKEEDAHSCRDNKRHKSN